MAAGAVVQTQTLPLMQLDGPGGRSYDDLRLLSGPFLDEQREQMVQGNKTVVLASSSPRRSELLRQIGLSFSLDAANVDERIIPGEDPEVYALRVARDKARIAAQRAGNGIVIAADTVVVLGDRILGKPADKQDAIRMLRLLSGKEHKVITGLSVMDAATGKTVSKAVVSGVRFRRLREEEISAYVDSGEPLDKAGAYGIQEKGALLVERVEGCYFNVVGMPLATLGAILEEFGVVLW
jgi:septum formation protein